MKKVSIIIPCYNQGKYIKDAIASALNQTYKNIEIICINDASTDATKDIIKKYADKHKNIFLIDLKQNQGVIYCRDYAIKMCTGDYILPLDSDDMIEKTFIEKSVKILEKNDDIGIVYTKSKYIGDKNKIINSKEFSVSEILFSNYIPNTALYRKSDYLRTKGYRIEMKNGLEDWDLWLSLIETGLKGYRIDEVLFYYRIYKEKSRNKINSDAFNLLKKIIFKNHYNLYMSSEMFIPDAFESFKIKYKKYKFVSNILIGVVSILLIINLILCFFVFK